MRAMIKHLELGVLELLLGMLIVAGLIGYVVPLPAEIEWLDHTVSFVLFSVLFYKLNVTEIILGKKSHHIDALVVLGFFLLFFKDMLAFTIDLEHHFSLGFLQSLAHQFKEHLGLIAKVTFHMGVLLLLYASIQLTRKSEVLDSSMLYALTHERARNSVLLKFILIFVALLAFYFFVYNMILEWLEFTLDDPIIFVGIFYYLSLLTKHKEKFDKEHFVFQIGEIADKLYSKFVLLFHYKHTLPIAIAGLLIMHTLADLGAFAYGYSINKENIYLAQLREVMPESHHSFGELFSAQTANLPPLHQAFSLVLYVFNALALIILLTIPALTWFKLFTHKQFHLPRWPLVPLFMAFSAFLCIPTFTINPIFNLDAGAIGVDIQTNSLDKSEGVLHLLGYTNNTSIEIAIGVLILSGILAWLISHFERGRKELYVITLVGGLVFYALYLYYYYTSLSQYIWTLLFGLALPQLALMALVFWIFFVLASLFYGGGYLLFLYEIYHEYRTEKWSDPQEKTAQVVEHLHSRLDQEPAPSRPELHH